MLEELKKKVYEANINLGKSGLVILTWGNVSAITDDRKYIIIKPSGVPYSKMAIDDMVITDLDGNTIEGKLRPSVDLPTHIELYKSFKEIKGITHTHSTYATSFGQAMCEVPCYGTTQADTFHGSIPLVRLPKKEELNEYTKNIGKMIVERFNDLDPNENPGAILAKHGVFSWGKSPLESVTNAMIIEECAKMAYLSKQINPNISLLPNEILELHYQRKHGINKSYGQNIENK